MNHVATLFIKVKVYSQTHKHSFNNQNILPVWRKMNNDVLYLTNLVIIASLDTIEWTIGYIKTE